MSNITVRHAKVSNIADHPVSVNAGEIVPSDWNADHNVSITSLDGVPIGSVTPSTGTFTTVTANDKVSLKNGTPPTSGDANTVHVYSSDLRTDATIPSVWTEGNIAADVSPTANRAIPIRINGVVYYLLASDVDYSTSPTLDLNFAASTSLDSRVTFTRASNGTYFNSAGTLTTAGNNVARLDYNPSTLAARGLLIEEQRTNSIRNNTMQGAVAGTPGTLPTNWTTTTALTGLTRQIVGTGTENGITYIDVKLSGTPSAAGRYDFYFDSSTAVAAAQNQVWTSSVYIKLQAGSLTGISSVRLYFEEKNSGGGYLVEQNITVTNPTSSALSTQRVTGTRTLNNASTAFLLSGLNYTLSGAAIDITLRIGMPQLEQGGFATSVISTTNAAATRNADVASVTTLTPWYNATTGTLLGEFSGVASGTRTIVALDDNTANESIVLQTVSTDPKFTVTDGGSTQADLDAGTVATGTIYKLAGAFASGDFAACIGGGTVQTDATGTVPAVDRLRLGASQAGNYLNGHMRRVAYYPVRLANASLQTITT